MIPLESHWFTIAAVTGQIRLRLGYSRTLTRKRSRYNLRMHANNYLRIDQLARLQDSTLLQGGKRGLEKESLRVTSDGVVASTAHPPPWGSALTHPYITTDYSEALPEFITPPHRTCAQTHAFLTDIHRFLYTTMPTEELLWCASMPCEIGDDAEIQIADYGGSNIGRMKHIYRVGLDYRYGRRMQAIAGVHFNYSLPDDFWPHYQEVCESKEPPREFIDDAYFALIRNFRRVGWLIPLLFGNSPALCKSFLAGRTTPFKQLDASTCYLPYATSLRMSNIGYKNKNQAALDVSYDSLRAYVASLSTAIRTPYPEYEAIGLYDDGERIQLNTNVLQIENEFYSFIRPKRSARSGEKPSTALQRRGVEYIEMRALDVQAYSPLGIDVAQLYFLEAFSIFCLLLESPALSRTELDEIEYNELTVALRGREPGLSLVSAGERRPMIEWTAEIFDAMETICALLDAQMPTPVYRRALHLQRDALSDPGGLPSARMLADLRSQQCSFAEFGLELSKQHAAHLRELTLDQDKCAQLESIASDSIAAQKKIEHADSESFEQYLERYFASDL